jgi:hypothetical protein
VPWRDITAAVTGDARWPKPTISVFRDRPKLLRVFRKATLAPHPRPPEIDFTRRQAIVIAAGPRSSTGYSLSIDEVTANDERIDVVVHEHTPPRDAHVTIRLAFPYLLITLPANRKRVHVRYAGRS